MNSINKRRGDEVLRIPFSAYAQFTNEYRGYSFSRNGERWSKYEVFNFVKRNKVNMKNIDLFFSIAEKPDFRNGVFVGEKIKS